MHYKFKSQSIYKFFSILLIASLFLSGPGFSGFSPVSAQGISDTKTAGNGSRESSLGSAELSAQGQDPLPNLSPITPDGWSGPVVVSSFKDTVTTGTLYEHQDAYIDWSVTNSGGGISNPFSTCLYFDGEQLQCWVKDGLAAGDAATQMDWVLSIPASPGLHHIEIVTDVDQVIPESNEDDNTWGFDFEWLPGITGPEAPGSPLINDVRTGPALPVSPENSTGSSAPGFYNISDYMAGKVAVGIIFPESTGSGENWTTARRDAAVSKIQAALNWWAQQASLNGVDLSFQIDVHYQVPTTYEPISLSSSQDGLWIDQVMTNMGYGGANYWEKARAYVNALRAQKSANWAFTYFVVDSLNDLDGKFSDAYFGYYYTGQSFVVMTYDNDGWGIDRMDRVAAHEMGHVFGAGDNYYQAGYGGCTSTTDPYGYLGIPNSNCAYDNPGAQTNVIMNDNSWNLHWSTAQQIGWRDSNSNGRMDPVDTAPGIKMNAYSPDPTPNTQLSYTGYAYDDPYPHHSCCTDVDVTINTINSVEYRVDGGGWNAVNASDGALNTDFEQFTFTTPVLANGPHTIEVRDQNSVGSFNASSWSDTVTVQGATPAFNKSSPSAGATAQPTSLTLDWGDSTGATSYEYCYDTTNDNACSNWTNTGTTSQAPISGLSYSTTYYWQVRANGSSGVTYANGSSTAFWSFTTQPASCATPSTPSLTEPASGATTSDSTPYFAWSPSTNADLYDFMLDNNSDFSSPIVNDTNTISSSYSASPTLGNGTYYWKVRGHNTSGGCGVYSGWTTPWSFIVNSAPGDFNKSAPTDGATDVSISPTLTWGDSSRATSYEYCYDTTNDNACSSWINTGTTSQASISGLSYNTTYYWQVRANNSSGSTYADGSSTAYWSFATPVVSSDTYEPDDIWQQAHTIASGSPQSHSIFPPADVDWVTFTLDSSAAITLETSGATDSDTRMWLYDSSLNEVDFNDDGSSGFYSKIDRQCGVNALPAGTYYVMVDEYMNDNLIPAYSLAYSLTAACSTPLAFAKTSPANTSTGQLPSLTLDWEDSSGATGYEYCYDTTNDNTCSNWTSTGTTSQAAISGLSYGATYYWQVRANNINGPTYANGSSTAYWTFSTMVSPVFNKTAPADAAANQPIHLILDWGDSGGATRYEYCYDTSNDSACSNWTTTGATSQASISGLSYATTYYWQVRANNSGGVTYANDSSTTYWSFTTMASPAFNKSTPVDAAVNQLTSLTLDWGASSGATGYEYCYDTTNDNTCSSWTSTGTTRQASISGLNYSTTYYWQVRANNSDGATYANGSSAAYWSFTTLASPAFIKMTPENGATGVSISPTLDWGDSSGATRYEYCYDTTNDNACSSWFSTGTTSQASMGGLSYATTYFWQVRAINAGGITYADSSNTAYWSFTTLASPVFNKSTPANAAANQPLSLTLDWGNSSGATSYEYCYDTSNDNTCSTWTSTGTTHQADISGLSYGTTYYWQVRANNSGGTTYANGSSTAYWTFSTMASPAFNKTSPADAAANQLTSLTLDWGASSGSSSYEYCFDSSNDNACSNWIHTGATSQASITGLSYATTYYWQVRANNSSGVTYANGSSTAYWSFTTLASPAFNKMTPANGATGVSTSPTLDWEDSSGATRYEYCYDTSNDSACTNWTSTSTTSQAAISGLNYGTTYYWQVRAVNAGGTTAANDAAWWSFTTVNPLPSIQTMDPEVTTAGSEGFVLTVRGSNFISGSVILWNSEPIATNIVNASTLTASIAKEQITSVGTVSIQVMNPAPGGGETAELPFRIITALPLNGGHPVSLRPTFDWEDINPASSYTLQVSTVNTFTSSVLLVKVPSSTYLPTVDLPKDKMLYWRVRPNFGTTAGPWSFKSLVFFTPNPPPVPGLILPANNALTTDTTPRLDWSDVTLPVGISLDHYQVEVAADAGFGTSVYDREVKVSEFTPDIDLSANTTYYWRVRSFNPQSQFSTWSLVRTFRTAIAAPILTVPANEEVILTTRPGFDWEDAAGATAYTLQVSTSNLFRTNLVNLKVPASKAVLITDLPRNTLLYWRVIANGTNGPSLWSNFSSFTSGNPPSIPVLRLPVSNTIRYDYRPRLDWNDVTLPLGTVLGHYQIQMDTNTAFSGPVVDAETTGSEFQPGVDLNANTTFYWRVRAFNSDGHFSAWSAVWILKTAPARPVQISPADLSTLLVTRPEFDWKDVNGATAYTLQVSATDLFKINLVNLKVPASRAVPTIDLPRNTLLYWRVMATSLIGSSIWSEVHSFTSGNPPSIPVLRLPVSNTISSDYRPLLDWYDVTVPAGTSLGHYQIQVDTSTTFSGPVVDAETTGSEFRPAGDLNSNTTFYWRVRAFNSDGHFSAWSAVRVLKTAPARPVLVSPANLSTLNTARPEFDWDDVNGATAYTLQVSTSSIFSTLLVNKTVTSSIGMMLTDLPKNRVLYWRVRAKAANGYSFWSDVWQVSLSEP